MTRHIVSLAWLAMVFCLSTQVLASSKPSNKAERIFQKALGEICSESGSLKNAKKYLDRADALDHPASYTLKVLHEARIEALGEVLAIPHEWCALAEVRQSDRKTTRYLPYFFDSSESAYINAYQYVHRRNEVPRHFEIAHELYLLSAAYNNYRGHLGLAELYAMEQFPYKDYGIALRYYEYLGHEGLPRGQLLAGEAYLFGQIVKRDLLEAEVWLDMATKKTQSSFGYSFPSEPLAFLRLGQLHYAQGDNDEALQALETIRQTNSDAAALIQKIEAESSPKAAPPQISTTAPVRPSKSPSRRAYNSRSNSTSTTDVLTGFAVLGGLWWALSSMSDDATLSPGNGDDSIKKCTNRIVECWPQIRLGGFGAGYYDMECARVYSGQNVKSCEERDVDINDRSYYCDPVTGSKGWTSNEVASASCR